jgi:hypothetical protein
LSAAIHRQERRAPRSSEFLPDVDVAVATVATQFIGRAASAGTKWHYGVVATDYHDNCVR